MTICPQCHHQFETPARIRSRQRQKSRSIEYVYRMMELLSLDVDPDDIRDAVDKLYDEGYFAKRHSIAS